jgi:hypothetical protein
MNRFWFKPRRYGYGATPVTWEGWVLVAIYVAVILTCVAALTSRGQTLSGWLMSVVVIVAATVAMIVIGVKKTDGAWRWQWGEPYDSGKAR